MRFPRFHELNPTNILHQIDYKNGLRQEDKEEDDEEDQHAEQLHHQAPITKPTPHTARNEPYTFCPYFTIS